MEKVVACPKCEHVFVEKLPNLSADEAARLGAAGSGVMLKCPKCQEQFWLPHHLLPKTARPSPITTEDGRPLVSRKWGEAIIWQPSPMRNGDPVYCQGVQVGTIRGTPPPEGPPVHRDAHGLPTWDWYIEAVPVKDMPAELASWIEDESAKPPERFEAAVQAAAWPALPAYSDS
jgi:hypothetical protein